MNERACTAWKKGLTGGLILTRQRTIKIQNTHINIYISLPMWRMYNQRGAIHNQLGATYDQHDGSAPNAVHFGVPTSCAG